jgi:soluble lytic murein transglycosylase
MRWTGIWRAAMSGGLLAAVAVEASAQNAPVPTPREKPAPSAAAPLAMAPSSDRERISGVIAALRRKDFPGARAAAAALSDPTAKTLGEWLYFQAEDPLVSAPAADAFLDAHPNWPSLVKIQANAERRMPLTLPAAQVLAFFKTRDPVTGEGRLQLARALFETGERAAAELQVREAWRAHNFQLSDEQRVLSVYGSTLTTEDHIARADRLLWSREPVSARRVFARLPERERRMGETRAALLSGAPNAPDLFDALPTSERSDPGVLHAAIRYFRRHESEPRAVELARQLPADPAKLRNPARLWEERQLLMRWALTERRYADAYTLAANAGLEGGTEFAEAEFGAGWIALRFLNAPERAEIHFAALAGSVTAPISRSRAFYWMGRAAAAKGDAPLAERRFKQAAAFPFTYYGQLAAERLGTEAAAGLVFPAALQASAEDKARFASRPAAAALRLLAGIPEADSEFLTFSYYLDDHLETAGEYLELKRIAEGRGAVHAVVRAGKVAIGRGVSVPEVSYPLISVPDRASSFAPKEIILGLTRQESEFNPKAFSPAGARGLMQLLPSTAQITARKEGIPYNKAALLNDPEQNMVLGAAHLSHLLANYNGSYIMTFAAYNAGPNRVTEWIGRYGDPRWPSVDPIDWVEQIPFQETRNYVQRVLENAQVYRARLTAKPIPGRLALDLERGGARGRVGAIAAIRAADLPQAPQRTFELASLAAIDAPESAPSVRLKPPAPEPAQSLPGGGSSPPAAVAQESAPSPQPSAEPPPQSAPAEPAAAPTASAENRPSSARSAPAREQRPIRAPAPRPEDSAAGELNARALAQSRASAALTESTASASVIDSDVAAKSCPKPGTALSDGGSSEDEAGVVQGDAASSVDC